VHSLNLIRAFALSVALVWFTGCAGQQRTPVEQTIAVTPVPEYLGVRPWPGAVLSVTEYQNLAPSLEWGAAVPCVCVGVDPLGLLEPGDSPTTEEWLARTRLVVDGNTITEYHSNLMSDLLGKEVRDGETDELLFKTPPGSPFRICYAVSLKVGLHMATFVVEKPSDEEWSYSWQFVITE